MTHLQGGGGVSLTGEVSRKLLHLASLIIPVGLLVFGKSTVLWFVVPAAAISVVSELARLRSERFRKFLTKTVGFMMRPEELPPVPAPIWFNGATWVLVTASAIAFLFPPEIAAAAIAIGLMGDAAAALVGRLYGKHRIWGSHKTLEGSIGFFLVSIPIIWIIPEIDWSSGLLGVLAATLVEAWGFVLNDNFAVPFAAALVMYLIT